MVKEELTSSLTEVQKFKHAAILRVDEKPILIIESKKDYIPIEEFKEIFQAVGELVKSDKIEKLIFDKRQLRIFHQPSMEWYFIHWKEEMWKYGLKTHRKLLPQDDIFRESVKIGREKIFRENPQLKAREMDIQYCDNLDEAIEN